MALIRWQGGDRDLRRAQNEMDALFSSLWSSAEGLTSQPWPRTDIYEDAEGVQLHFDVPGLDPNAVKVQIHDNTLTVSGERKLEHEEKRGNYHRIESGYGSFERSFSLPQNLDTEKVNAQYKNGVLKVLVPKTERAKPRSVQVKIEHA